VQRVPANRSWAVWIGLVLEGVSTWRLVYESPLPGGERRLAMDVGLVWVVERKAEG
jgi:hypothetical protein